MCASEDRPPQDTTCACRLADSPAPFRTPANFRYTRKCILRTFNNLRTLTHDGILTLAFPFTSGLFVRSCARVKHSTPLLSSACALFRGTTGGQGTPTEITTFHKAVFPGSACPSQRVSIVSQRLSKRSIRPIETLRFTCRLYPRIFAPLALPTQEAISKRRQS
jgi:hypothetical protein